MPADLLREGSHLLTVCNACRYCEGYCAVWKAMERRLVFKESDLNYLANLCHNCGECYYSCQYSPPHEFNINPPKTFAKIRLSSYEQYAWPRPLAKAFRANGLLGFHHHCYAALSGAWPLEVNLSTPVGDGNFYRIVPHAVMVRLFGGVGLFITLALMIGFLRFWRNSGEPYSELANPAALRLALNDALRLKNLENGGEGCAYPSEESSQALRWFHHATFYGFLSCFVATTLGAFDYYVLGLHRPPAYASLPVIFGTLGGIGLVIGPIGLFPIEAAPQSRHRQHQPRRDGRVLHCAAGNHQHHGVAVTRVARECRHGRSADRSSCLSYDAVRNHALRQICTRHLSLRRSTGDGRWNVGVSLLDSKHPDGATFSRAANR